MTDLRLSANFQILVAVKLQKALAACLLLVSLSLPADLNPSEDKPALRSTTSAGEKAVGKLSSFLKPSVPTRPFMPHTVLAPSNPLSLYPAHFFSHHSVASIPLYPLPRLSPRTTSQFLYVSHPRRFALYSSLSPFCLLPSLCICRQTHQCSRRPDPPAVIFKT